jgi:hypothetical protein
MPDRSPRPPGAAGDPLPPCGRRFPEELLSGYLDDALTQSDEQRVRIHREDCVDCRAEVEAMSAVREAARTTRFTLPGEDQWDERPGGGASRLLRGGGWVMLIGWLAAIAGYAAWHLATGGLPVIEKLALFAGVTGGALLFFSALIDRLRALPGDRYQKVKK